MRQNKLKPIQYPDYNVYKMKTKIIPEMTTETQI